MEWIADLRHWATGLLTDMLHWVEAFAAHPQGGWVLMALAFAESSFFPIPPDALLIPLALGDPSKAFFFATLCSIGSVAGGAAGYAIGYVGGRPLLRRLFSDQKIEAVRSYYDRYNAWATGIGGLTPLPYKLFTISGGAFGINFKIFLLASIVARSLRFYAVAAIIYWVGEPAKEIIERHLGWMAIAFVVLLVLGFWVVSKGFGHASRSAEEG